MAKENVLSNVCKSCGGTNDLLADVCMFCKKPLLKIATERISNEDLIQKASEWIENSKMRYISTGVKKEAGIMNDEELEITNTEIRSMATKYLSVLRYRSSIDSFLERIYSDLQTKFDAIKPRRYFSPSFRESFEAFIFLAIIAVFLLVLAFSLQT